MILSFVYRCINQRGGLRVSTDPMNLKTRERGEERSGKGIGVTGGQVIESGLRETLKRCIEVNR